MMEKRLFLDVCDREKNAQNRTIWREWWRKTTKKTTTTKRSIQVNHFIFFTKPTSMWEDERFLFFCSYALWTEHLIPIQAKVTFVHSHYIYPDLWCERAIPNSIRRRHVRGKKGSTFGVSRLLSEWKNQMLCRQKKIDFYSFDLLGFCWKCLKHFGIGENVWNLYCMEKTITKLRDRNDFHDGYTVE